MPPETDNPDKAAGFAAKGPIKITITISGQGLGKSGARKRGARKKKAKTKRARK